MDELAVVVDLSGEVRVVFVGGLEHNLLWYVGQRQNTIARDLINSGYEP